MKSARKTTMSALSLLALSLPVLHGQEEKPVIDYKKFKTDAFNREQTYSHTLGWDLFPIHGSAKLYEAHSASSAFFQDGMDMRAARLEDGKIRLDKVSKDEIAKLRLDTSLAIGELDEKNDKFTWADEWVILARLRESFQMYNDASPGFDLKYRSYDGEEDLVVKGALMFDIYPGPLYTRGWQPANYKNPYRFWFRTGIETEHDGNDIDRNSYYFLLNAFGNPDQDLELFDGAVKITSPQLFQLGVAFDDDRNSGEQDTRLILSWQPALFLQDGFTLDGKKRVVGTEKISTAAIQNEENRSFGSGFAINHKMYFRKLSSAAPFSLYSPFYDVAEKETKKSDWYTIIPMDVSLSSSSDAVKESTSDDSFGGAAAKWNVGLGGGNDKLPFRLTYLCEGESPLDSISESRICHSFTLAWSVGMTTDDHDGKNNDPKEIYSGLSFEAKYRTGEFDDEPGSHDEVTVGTKFRF